MCMEYTTLLRLATVMQRDNNNIVISLTVMPALKTLSPRWCLSIRMTLPPCRKEHKNKINFLFLHPPLPLSHLAIGDAIEKRVYFIRAGNLLQDWMRLIQTV